MRKHLHRWGAGYLLVALFLASWVGQFIAMLVEVGNEARSHGETFAMSEFWPTFWSATFENWQSEWFQLAVQAFVLLGLKHILFKADAEDLERIEMKLDSLLDERGIDPKKIEQKVEAAAG